MVTWTTVVTSWIVVVRQICAALNFVGVRTMKTYKCWEWGDECVPRVCLQVCLAKKIQGVGRGHVRECPSNPHPGAIYGDYALWRTRMDERAAERVGGARKRMRDQWFSVRREFERHELPLRHE